MHSYQIDRDQYVLTNRAIGLYIKRSDGVILHNPEYFPLSQVQIDYRADGSIRIMIPNWLIDKKLSNGYSIVERR